MIALDTTRPGPREPTRVEPHTSLAQADVRLWIALLTATLWHGGLLVSGSYRRTYDAYIHMFFGDHYARDWFSTWEPRWYTGFTVTSYPPGTHQLIAALHRVIPLEAAFVVVQIFAIIALIVGVYRFTLIWFDQRVAGWAAILAVASTAISEVVHVFGQLPTSFSLAMLLNALPSIYAWVRNGSYGHLGVGVAMVAATTAAHHVTTLFGAVFFVGPVVATAVIDALRTPRPGEPPGHSLQINRQSFWPTAVRRLRRVFPALARSMVIGFASIVVLVVVVLPYWLWSASDPIVQIPIPHASRDNFFENTAAGIVFFIIPWGPLIALLPVALLRGAFSRALPLAASVGLLFVLGTGGTTPIPRLLLGGAFDILTLDRFTIWATIGALPLIASMIPSLTGGRAAAFGRAVVGRRSWTLCLGVSAAVVVAAAVLAANFAQFRPLQPDRIDPQPIAAFMSKDQHDRWRYLTLGFGDQMARVAAETTATTVDGNYHSARRLPELTSRSVERLEGAKFRGVPGIGSLQQFLGTPDRYNLKFVFSNDVFYDPLLWASGWHRLDRLINGVVVWEREDVPPLPDVLPSSELPDWQRAMWGIMPLTALATASVAFAWNLAGQPIPLRVSRGLTSAASRVRRSRMYKAGQRVDTHFERIASSAATEQRRAVWHSDLYERLVQRFTSSGPPSRQTRWIVRVFGAGLGAAALLVAFSTGTDRTPAASPTTQVHAWYDDLDFQRFDDAWERLDPVQRTSFDQFQLERSVVDGLLSGYAKLDAVVVEQTFTDANRSTVRARATYISSLAVHEVDELHELVRRGDSWYLIPDPSDVSTTPDQFSRTTEIAYLSQGRRQVTTERTTFSDVLDRPRLQTISAQAVVANGRLSIVGEITNLDVDPADLTVQAIIRSSDGQVLAEHNASVATIHKVLPRETVPFRVDVEDVAGASDSTTSSAGDFYPDLFAEPTFDISEVGSIDLIARAVVTGRDLERPLALEQLAASVEGQTFELSGVLRNTAVQTATIPHILVAFLDDRGEVGWVDHIWIQEAVRPQRLAPFNAPLTNADAITPLDIPIQIFGNGITRSEGAPFVGAPSLQVPPASGWTEARITSHAFSRSTR